ncbi:hypothetical protein [Labilibaculum euxinus]
MKKILIGIVLNLSVLLAFGQSIDCQNFTVGGDFDKFYPVVFEDAGWGSGATQLEISRSNVHTNSNWRGSLIAKFRFHTIRWGHSSHFCDADIKFHGSVFIADYKDATGANGTLDFIIWLRGGGTTYDFRSINAQMNIPRVYDGIANSLPFKQVNGPNHSYLVSPNSKLNQKGATINYTSYFLGGGVNFMEGQLGIGIQDVHGNKLAVAGNAAINGTLMAKEVKVQTNVWADFVFNDDYHLTGLMELESFIKTNNHLPDIPSEEKVLEEGVSLGKMDAKLLQKIEELTLYVIDLSKSVETLKTVNQTLQQEIENLKK